MMTTKWRTLAWLLPSLGLLLAGTGSAEVRRLEAVGVTPVLRAAGGPPPKDAAIDAGLRGAVERVAESLLHEQGLSLIDLAPTRTQARVAGDETGWDKEPIPSDPQQRQALEEAGEERLAQILGKGVVDYTARFRILEDRGERPALFVQDSDHDTEYQVIVEVDVDVDRVRSRLVRAGVLEPLLEPTNLEGIRIEVRGVTAYPGYLALREALLTGAGATEVQALEYERGRILLDVRSESEEIELLARLQTTAPATLEIVPLDLSSTQLTLAVTWDPSARQPAPEYSDAPPGIGGEERRSTPGDLPTSTEW